VRGISRRSAPGESVSAAGVFPADERDRGERPCSFFCRVPESFCAGASRGIAYGRYH
jgi:hypothetical protein